MANFAYRLKRQIKHLESVKVMGKFNGAVGNFNAHICAYPDLDWQHIKCVFSALAIPKLPSPFSKSIGLTLCGMVDEPTSPAMVLCLK
jgi:adenylosuccinate lyase